MLKELNNVVVVAIVLVVVIVIVVVIVVIVIVIVDVVVITSCEPSTSELRGELRSERLDLRDKGDSSRSSCRSAVQEVSIKTDIK